MSRFSWLHLTDLHLGQSGQGPLFHAMKSRFLEDLAVLHDKTGPWNVVLFSGDLVQRGGKDEFARLEEELLDPLWKRMGELGSKPKLLAVPGNHDLERPRHLTRPSAALRLLLQNGGFHQIADEFFGEPKGEYRKVVTKAFSNYVVWWKATSHRAPTVRDGLLPGEFSATLDADGVRVGVVGLNTTFLQLAGGDYSGRLVLDVRQFNAACTGRPDGDGAGWVANHDACLLMTHQGFDWLDQRSQKEAYPEINPAGRFAVHIFGHMHENVVRGTSSGGGKAIYWWQGNSLFGMEPIGDALKVERRHGYSAGTIDFNLGQAAADLRHWPRKAVNQGPNGWLFDRDGDSCVLDKSKDDGGTEAVRLPLLVKQKLPPPVAAGHTLSDRDSGGEHFDRPGPGAPSAPDTRRHWLPAVFYPLQRAENFAGREALLERLTTWATSQSTTRVFALVAPGGTGKTALAERVLDTMTRQHEHGVFVWSFYENQRTEAFLRAAVRYFTGDEPRDPGGLLERLQRALSGTLPHLFILDGLELVQATGSTGRPRGELEDPVLRRFICWLASGPGTQAKALLTSRFPLPELNGWIEKEIRISIREIIEEIAHRFQLTKRFDWKHPTYIGTEMAREAFFQLLDRNSTTAQTAREAIWRVFRRRGAMQTDAELDLLINTLHQAALRNNVPDIAQAYTGNPVEMPSESVNLLVGAFRLEQLDDLDFSAARAVLRRWGVRGDNRALDALTESVHGHALTIDVLGSYLGTYHDGDPAQAPSFDPQLLQDTDSKTAKLNRVLTSYAEKLSRQERDVLTRLSIFPRGERVEVLSIVAEAGVDVAASLASATPIEIRKYLERLRSLGLVFRYDIDGCAVFTAHPFLRGFFGRLLGVENPQQIHEAVRSKLAAGLEERPVNYPTDPSDLDKYERLIEATRLAGQWHRAFELYTLALGGSTHLGGVVGENSRGLRIVSAFSAVGSPDNLTPALLPNQCMQILNDWSRYSESLGDLATTRKALREYKRVCKEAGSHADRALGLQNLVLVAFLTLELPDAVTVGEKSLQQAIKAKERRLSIFAHTLLAVALIAQGRHAEAQTHSTIADVNENYPQLFSSPWLWDADTKFTLGDRKGAVTKVEQHLTIALANRWTRSIAFCQALLGRCVLPDVARARKYLNEARQYTQSSGNIEVTLRCYLLAAEIARYEQQYEIGASESVAGLQLSDSLEFTRWSVDLRLELARIRLATNDPADAIRLAEWSLETSEHPNSQYTFGAAEALHLLSLAYCQTGELSRACECLLRANSKRGSCGLPHLVPEITPADPGSN